jgi:ABC-2 type transport system ATP-binding protein
MEDDSMPCAELRGVTRRFGATLALDRVDFQMSPREVVTLLGPNGAGKTTLVRILLGLIRAHAGTVRLWDRAPSDSEARRRVGVMLQVSRVPEVLKVREHVHLFSSYYGSPVPVDEVLDLAGVRAIADRRFGELSGGQRQRALFALAICGRPDLLVLDEPTVGLDVEARRDFWTAVRSIMDRGCAVLLTTHNLDEADTVADRVVMLKRGLIVADASPSAVKASGRHQSAPGRSRGDGGSRRDRRADQRCRGPCSRAADPRPGAARPGHHQRGPRGGVPLIDWRLPCGCRTRLRPGTS